MTTKLTAHCDTFHHFLMPANINYLIHRVSKASNKPNSTYMQYRVAQIWSGVTLAKPMIFLGRVARMLS